MVMPKIFGAILIVLSNCIGLVVSSPAHALDIQPGLWQDTETGEVNGKPIPRKVSTDCVTPADAKDIVERAQAELRKSMKDQTQKCSKLGIRQNGNVVTFEMKCGDPKQGSIDATTVITIHSPQHTTNVAKSTMNFIGQKIVSTITTDSKWIAAACKK
jgi:Protein of unknown function (DUF3617)